MHTNEPRELQGVELGYDPRDIDAPKIYKIVVFFFLFTLFFFGLGAVIFARMGWGGRTAFDSRKPLIVGPKLQGNVSAKVDIMKMRQDERRFMTTYDRLPDGKWRIPVDRALDLVAKEGLPEVVSDKKAVSPGNTIPQNATGPAGSTTPTSPATDMTGAPTPSDLPTRDPGMSAPATGGTTPPAGP